MRRALASVLTATAVVLIAATGSSAHAGPLASDSGMLRVDDPRALRSKEIPSREEFAAEMRRLSTSEQYLNDILERTMAPLTGERRSIAKEHFSLLFQAPEVINRFYDLLSPLVQRRADVDYKELGFEVVLSLALRGMKRLPAEEQVYYLRILQGVLASLPPEVCKSILDGKASFDVQRDAETYWLESQPPATARRVFALYRAALLAELRDKPTARMLTPKQSELAQKAFEASLELTFGARPNAAALFAAAADLPNAAAPVSCESGRLMFQAATSVTEPLRTWVVQNIFNSMAE
jgi:hypothetical protein